jgi:hypothetical protein
VFTVDLWSRTQPPRVFYDGKGTMLIAGRLKRAQLNQSR